MYVRGGLFTAPFLFFVLYIELTNGSEGVCSRFYGIISIIRGRESGDGTFVRIRAHKRGCRVSVMYSQVYRKSYVSSPSVFFHNAFLCINAEQFMRAIFYPYVPLHLPLTHQISHGRIELTNHQTIENTRLDNS